MLASRTRARRSHANYLNFSFSARRVRRISLYSCISFSSDAELLGGGPHRFHFRLAAAFLRGMKKPSVSPWRVIASGRPPAGCLESLRRGDHEFLLCTDWRVYARACLAIELVLVIFEALIESDPEVPKHLARRVHDCYFDPNWQRLSVHPRSILHGKPAPSVARQLQLVNHCHSIVLK
jgi:hypothetical protein